MKKINFINKFGLFILFFCILEFLSLQSRNLSYNSLRRENAKILIEAEQYKDSLNIYKKAILFFIKKSKAEYGHIEKSVIKYNPEITTQTISSFLKTIEHYNLENSQVDKDLLVAQLIYESGFKQHYTSNHKTKSGVIKSPSGAVGICQIMPNTGYHYLRISKNSNNHKDLKELGCDNLYFTEKFTKHIPNIAQKKQVSSWLSNEKNNFALWGFIMKDLFKKYKSPEKVLVAYNAGEGFLKKNYKTKEGARKFSYVKKIYSISTKIKKAP